LARDLRRLTLFDWYTEDSEKALKSKYFLPGEGISEACRRLARTAAEIYPEIPEFEEKIYNMLEKGWIAPASPVWANFGAGRGLPISCFSSSMDDNIESILDTHSEVCMLTKMGGGTAGYFGNLRAKNSPLSGGGSTNGPVAFMQMFDTAMRVVSQSNVRRGSFAAYLPIDHPDISDFLLINEKGNPIQDLSFGVTVKDQWLEEMIAGDPEKRDIWSKVLKSRKEKGMPYVIFIDTVNNNSTDVYQDNGIKVTHSNLCSEILLQTNSEKTFVCCLTAMNLEKYDEWKDADSVRYLTYFLDAVMEDFIRKADGMYGLERAVKFAKEERALGMGATGWHSLLKRRMVPFDSLTARYLTIEVFEFIQIESFKASEQLAEWYGEPSLLEGYGRRNSHLMAIAPNTSSGEIIGVSQSIEPDRSNYFTKELAWGTVPGKKCKYLKALLAEKHKDTREVWESILEMNGSVQHLDFLSPKEKSVFKTFWEIDQYELLRQAGIRQKYIDQGQSLNIFVPPKTTAKEMNDLHLHAWKCGVKGLYYQRSESPGKWKDTRSGCSSCEG
jgi:ribonucleoside-diphosphate reductase alpha chain